ncbi:uncharacterized protein LOC129596051 [Paramacrobiotus metropolitanus]|uniref:uncharacterized protein LOC129596051 n=1 Tax=Paramacrobiotus metropolitanus TaxID=2943436 RepID=UPI00244600CE|nr:uncharacterized protein LOC129596051 [Paramacrobiotus metropolitanus]
MSVAVLVVAIVHSSFRLTDGSLRCPVTFLKMLGSLILIIIVVVASESSGAAVGDCWNRGPGGNGNRGQSSNGFRGQGGNGFRGPGGNGFRGQGGNGPYRGPTNGGYSGNFGGYRGCRNNGGFQSSGPVIVGTPIAGYPASGATAAGYPAPAAPSNDYPAYPDYGTGTASAPNAPTAVQTPQGVWIGSSSQSGTPNTPPAVTAFSALPSAARNANYPAAAARSAANQQRGSPSRLAAQGLLQSAAGGQSPIQLQ